MKIPYEPVDNQGNSNQYYYEQIIKAVATLVEKNNFRIIDEENSDITLYGKYYEVLKILGWPNGDPKQKGGRGYRYRHF